MKFEVQNGKPRRAAHSGDLPRAGKYGDTAGKRKCRNIAISRREPPQKANSPTPFNLFCKIKLSAPDRNPTRAQKRICAMQTSGACK